MKNSVKIEAHTEKGTIGVNVRVAGGETTYEILYYPDTMSYPEAVDAFNAFRSEYAEEMATAEIVEFKPSSLN